MSYGRDPHARHRGVGAVAAADHLRGRKVARRRAAVATANRDAQLAGLTYGRTGGLSGYGALEALGVINTTGTPMQNPRQPLINGGGGLDTPPAPPRGGNPYNPTVVTKPPQVYVPPTPAPPFVPPRRPMGPLIGGVRPTVTTFPTAPGTGTAGGSVLCSRADALLGRCGTTSTGGGSTSTGGGSSGGGSTSGGGSSGGGGGGGAGVITGGADLPVMTPPPDVPDAPDTSSGSVVGLTTTGKVVVGALVLGGLYFLTRKK